MANPDVQLLLQHMIGVGNNVPRPPTQEQIAELVGAAMKQTLPKVAGIIEQLDALFDKALSEEDLRAFKEYRDRGAPGLKALIDSEKLYPVVQLLWDEIKQNASNL